MLRYNIKIFAAVCGFLWGGTLFLISIWVWLREGPTARPFELGRVYPGYGPGPIGSLFGLVWGVIDGLIGGGLFAWLYNALSRKAQPTIEIKVSEHQ
jgi:hypothetical protein